MNFWVSVIHYQCFPRRILLYTISKEIQGSLRMVTIVLWKVLSKKGQCNFRALWCGVFCSMWHCLVCRYPIFFLLTFSPITVLFKPIMYQCSGIMRYKSYCVLIRVFHRNILIISMNFPMTILIFFVHLPLIRKIPQFIFWIVKLVHINKFLSVLNN